MRAMRAYLRLTVVFAVWLSACSAPNAALERLDERTGVVLRRAREPVVFARTEPRYSRSMRDYLYVGPVETNRQGVREYFLWVGIATTLDRGFIAPAADLPRTLYVTVDGEPIELPLARWHDLVRTQFTAPLYPTAVPVRAELAARVTLQQLSLLEGGMAEAVSVDARAYRRWETKGDFAEFLAEVTAR